jgi:hypothetical protein
MDNGERRTEIGERIKDKGCDNLYTCGLFTLISGSFHKFDYISKTELMPEELPPDKIK